MKKKLVILTGAGISAESGIPTFRDSNGLWNNYKVEDVATPGAWLKNKELVLEFYNERRTQIKNAEPNQAHRLLVNLEEKYDVYIITQNIDDLHERAGSQKILHLHGEILKSRSRKYPELIYDCPGDIKIGDLCEKGSQLRPHIVWFGEAVPMLPTAEGLVYDADILVIIGTSLQVYPAASLFQLAPKSCPIYVVDPNLTEGVLPRKKVTYIKENATTGVEKLIDILMVD